MNLEVLHFILAGQIHLYFHKNTSLKLETRGHTQRV